MKFVTFVLFLFLLGCSEVVDISKKNRSEAPIPISTVRKFIQVGSSSRKPVLIRIFKEEAEMELWKYSSVKRRFFHVKTYPICKWSGKLGPKIREGDLQSPEGFYIVDRNSLNPYSKYYLSFKINFPNVFDRSLSRTGSNIMVHGKCRSVGCFAIKDDQIKEVYAILREAFLGGQKRVQIQIFPFKMTSKKLAVHWNNSNRKFWLVLKQGYDNFRLTGLPVRVSTCGGRYYFNSLVKFVKGRCIDKPINTRLNTIVVAKQARDIIGIMRQKLYKAGQ